jgi:hypothetical protein
MTLYFGLGKADKVERIEVRWPTGRTDTWERLAANRTLVLTEGSDLVESVAWSSVLR